MRHCAEPTRLTPGQLDKVLLRHSREISNERPETLIKSESRIVAGIDASSLFEEDIDYYSGQTLGRLERLKNGIEDVRQTGLSFRHKFQVG